MISRRIPPPGVLIGPSGSTSVPSGARKGAARARAASPAATARIVTVRNRPASAPDASASARPQRMLTPPSPSCRTTCRRKFVRRCAASIRTTSHSGRASFRIRPGTPGPGSDIEQGRGRLGKRGEQHEGLHHEVPDPRGAVPVGGQAADALPALELLEVGLDLGRKGSGQREAERRGRIPERPPEILRDPTARRSRARGRRLRPGAPPARRPSAAPHCGRSGTAARWTGSCSRASRAPARWGTRGT